METPEKDAVALYPSFGHFTFNLRKKKNVIEIQRTLQNFHLTNQQIEKGHKTCFYLSETVGALFSVKPPESTNTNCNFTLQKTGVVGLLLPLSVFLSRQNFHCPKG